MPTLNDIETPPSASCPACPDVAEVNQPYVGQVTGVRRIGRWLLRLAGQLRRQYLSHLRPGYVKRMKAERRGECRRCGACCNLTFHCPFYDATVGCRIYLKRPLTCRDFPIDARDHRMTRVPCGHYYDSGGPRSVVAATSQQRPDATERVPPERTVGEGGGRADPPR